MRLALAACLAASFALPAAAQAQSTPSASAIISGFNAFTQGNFTTGHDVEGPFVVGGNLSGSGSVFNLGIPLPASVNGIANVAVIDISASLLGSYPSLSVNPNGAGTVIINVTGNYSAQPNWQNGAAWRDKVIWNFENATSIDFGATGIQGTVIAPLAAVTNANPIEGASSPRASAATANSTTAPSPAASPC